MATEDLSKTGQTTLQIKDPLPDVSEDTMENPVGFIPAEQASTSLVAGQTEVNPLATDLPDTQLMNELTNYTNVNFNSSLVDPTVIGSSRYMTAGGIRKDATTSDNILPGDTFSEQDDFYTQISEAMGDTWKGSGAQQAADIYAGGNLLGEFDTSYTPSAFATTSDFVQAFQSAPVVENITDYKTVTPPVNLWGAGAMVWNTLTENAFIKGVKNNPSKYMNNDKYVKDAEGWFAKQAHKQFGAIFEENPTSALRVAEANKALYEYLQSTQAGRQKARDMGLNLDNINKNYEQAKSFETSANNIAQSYSAYQTGGDYDVSTKNTAYANMSQSDLDDTNPAGHNQYSGMSIGGKGVYVDISDGIASGTSFASGTIFVKWKKEERERRAKEAAAAEAEAAAAEAAAEAAAVTAAATTAAAAEPTGDDGWQPDYSGAVADQQQQAAEAGQTHEQFMSDLDAVMAKGGLVSGPHHWQEGGRVSFQAGGPTGNPMGQQQEQQQPIQDAGNLELVQEQGKDQSGVADDVKRDLNEGDFVINAPAMEMAGRGDIERMIMKAVTELQRKGVKLDFGQAAEDADSIVQALVSNKEMIIPKVIAEQIGYDRLEKINNRGKERVDEIEKEKAQQQKGFIQPNPQGQSPQPVQVGGQITLEENKNQPIAVPRESFATMSSVGKRLLSPLSPEQADKELTELSKPSQSFEGFVKPIGMADGGKLEFTDEEFDRLISKESSGDPKSEGDIETGDTAVGLTQVRGLALEDVNNELGTSYTKDDLLNDPEINKLVGKTYLNQQLKRFNDKRLALAAYNAGPGRVNELTQGSMLNYHKLSPKIKDYVSFILDKTIPEIKPKPQQTGMMAVN